MRAERLCGLAFASLLACTSETHSLGEGLRDAAPPPTSRADAGTRPMFEPPRPIAALDDGAASDDDPSLTVDLTELYFNTKREGGQGREDIWFTTRATAGVDWPAPSPATELNSEDRETGIALSADGLTVWFSSDRAGGAGGLDIYTATRATRTERFSGIVRSEPLNSSGDDLVSSVDLDGRTLYLARRDDEDDDYDLFVAQRGASDFAPPEPIASLNSEREESDAFALAGGAQLLFTRSKQLVLSMRGVSGVYGAPEVLSELNSDDDDRDAWASEDLSYLVFSSDRSGTYLLYESRRRDSEGNGP